MSEKHYVDLDNAEDLFSGIRTALDDKQDELDLRSVTATGNPLSFSTDSAQVAQNTVITFEPIQAGSGDPSPSNVREIEGYVKAELVKGGVNLATAAQNGGFSTDTGMFVSDAPYAYSEAIIEGNTEYTVSFGNESTISSVIFWDASHEYISYISVRATKTFTSPANAKYCIIQTGSVTAQRDKNNVGFIQIEKGSSATTFTSYASDISEQLPTTLYGFKLNVESGELIVTHKRVDMGSLDWTYGTYVNKLIFYAGLTGFKAPTASSPSLDVICEKYGDSYTHNTMSNVVYNMTDKSLGGVFDDAKILVYDTTYSDVTTFKAAMSGVYLVYELATPIVYHLTPHQVKLLQGANTVTTNGTSISLTYRKGEVARLSDLNGIAESVEGTFNKIVYDVNANVRAIKTGNIVTLLISKNINNATAGWHSLATLPEMFRPASDRDIYFCGMDDSATTYANTSPINSWLTKNGGLSCYIFSDKTSVNYRGSLTYIC